MQSGRVALGRRSIGFVRLGPSAPDKLDLKRDASYQRLWVADLVSQVGTQVTFLALPLIAVLTLRSPAWQLGLLRAAEYAPGLLALRIGLLADRRSRRAILVTADLAQAAILVVLPVLHVAHVLSIGALLAVAVVLGTFSLAFGITAQSFLPDVVGKTQLTEANAGLQLSNSAGQLVGPTLATLLIAAVTAPDAVLADAASFVVSAALLARVRTTVRAAQGGAPERAGSGASDGLRFLLQHPQLRPLALVSALTNAALGITEALLVLFAVRGLQIPTAIIGVVFTIGNVGILVGAASSSRISRRLGMGRACLAGLGLEVLGLALLPLAPSGVIAIAVLGCAGLLSTTGIIIYNVGQVTLRQRAAPGELIGRVTAGARLASLTGLLAGSLAGGLLGQLMGTRPALVVAVAITLTAAAVAYFSPLRQFDGKS